MKWIKAKMQEMGVEKNPNYKIAFYVDSLAMITVEAPKYGVVQVRQSDNYIGLQLNDDIHGHRS